MSNSWSLFLFTLYLWYCDGRWFTKRNYSWKRFFKPMSPTKFYSIVLLLRNNTIISLLGSILRNKTKWPLPSYCPETFVNMKQKSWMIFRELITRMRILKMNLTLATFSYCLNLTMRIILKVEDVLQMSRTQIRVFKFRKCCSNTKWRQNCFKHISSFVSRPCCSKLSQ